MAHMKNVLKAVVLAVILENALSFTPTQVVEIGAHCDSQQNLCPAYSGCLSGTCICNDGFIPSSDNKNCLKLASEWQGPCKSSLECQNFVNAICKDKTCQCETNHHYLNGKCWLTKHLNDACQDSDECLLVTHEDRIECNGGSCQCISPYHINDLGNDCNGCNAVWNLGLTSLLLAAFVKLLLN